tara:strand:+ start:414 stop:1022 length:609 start_codon:yes stop_codon:yes gene_type:complete
MVRFIRFVAAFSVLIGVFVFSGCTPDAPSAVKTDAINFYSDFVLQATSLNPADIQTVYDEFSNQDAGGMFAGQPTDTVRDLIFQGFSELNPELFGSLYTKDVSYNDLGAAYSNILLMSLATQGNGVVAEMPLDAVTYDAENDVFLIDRNMVTAPVPLVAESLVSQYEGELPPVTLKITLDGWKVIPDSYMLYEVGVPDAELL